MLNIGGWFGVEKRRTGEKARALVRHGALLLDVRSREEFAAGHLDGAANIPVHELGGRIGELPGKGGSVVVYCRSGARSASAASLLRSHGYDVYDLGPMSAW